MIKILGEVSYGGAAVIYFILSALLISGWERRYLGVRLFGACAAMGLWALLLAADSYGSVPAVYIYLGEILHSGVWLWVLLGVASGGISRLLGITVRSIYLALLFVRLLMFPAEQLGMLADGVSKKFFLISGLMLALTGLVLLEQLYRNATQIARQNLRHFVIATGLIFAYDLFLYAQAQLLNSITTEVWQARGFIMILSALILMRAPIMRRNINSSLNLFVSREVVFHTATLVAVGVYLLVMALAGYYVRLVKGDWATFAQLIFFFGAGAVLVWLLGSSALRRQLKVFISKHFYRNKYDYRVQWLRFINTLSSGTRDDIHRTSVQAVAQVFESVGGVLYLADERGRQFSPVAAWPMQLDSLAGWVEIANDDELILFLKKRQWIIDLVEYRRSPDVYQNCRFPEWLTDEPGMRIISPIFEQGELMGFFALLSPPDPFELVYEDRDLLKTVGHHVATQIAQHQADQKLAENRQFEAFNRFVAFTMHDLKNSIAQLKMAVSNAEHHKRNPEFVDDVMDTIGNVAERMTRLMEQLLRGEITSDSQRVNFSPLVSTVLSRCSNRKPMPEFETTVVSCFVHADPDRLAMVLEHLVRNAQEATAAHGKVKLRLVSVAGCAEFNIVDNGTGMDADFIRKRLFRPFDSTKGTKGMGIGVYQAREYIRQIGGELEVRSSPGQGTHVSIRLPLWGWQGEHLQMTHPQT